MRFERVISLQIKPFWLISVVKIMGMFDMLRFIVNSSFANNNDPHFYTTSYFAEKY